MGPHNLEDRAKAGRWTARRRVCPYRASSPAITIEPADETLPEDHARPGAGIPGTTARGAETGHALGPGEPGEPPAGHYRREILRFPGQAGPGRALVQADPGNRRPGLRFPVRTELVGALDDQQGQVRRDLNRKIIELASSLAGQEQGEYSQSDHRQHGRGGVAAG